MCMGIRELQLSRDAEVNPKYNACDQPEETSNDVETIVRCVSASIRALDHGTAALFYKWVPFIPSQSISENLAGL